MAKRLYVHSLLELLLRQKGAGLLHNTIKLLQKLSELVSMRLQGLRHARHASQCSKASTDVPCACWPCLQPQTLQTYTTKLVQQNLRRPHVV